MGPYSLQQAQDMLEARQLTPDDYAWRQGNEWVPLQTLIPAQKPTVAMHTTKKSGPTGVGGWIFVFCFGIGLVGPLLTAGRMLSDWEKAKPYFARAPAFRAALLTENIGVVVILVLGIWTANRILKGDTRGKQLAKRYLIYRLIITLGAGAITFVILIVAAPSEFVTAGVDGMIPAQVANAFVVGLWWWYFARSKRVRNMYG